MRSGEALDSGREAQEVSLCPLHHSEKLLRPGHKGMDLCALTDSGYECLDDLFRHLLNKKNTQKNMSGTFPF